MDKCVAYRTSIQHLFQQLDQYHAETNDIERELLLDEQRDHYQLLNIGWQGEHRIYGCVLHVDLKGDKIWIQQNGMEFDVVAALMNSGVAREDIVLGFQSPAKRQLIGCAIA